MCLFDGITMELLSCDVALGSCTEGTTERSLGLKSTVTNNITAILCLLKGLTHNGTSLLKYCETDVLTFNI